MAQLDHWMMHTREEKQHFMVALRKIWPLLFAVLALYGGPRLLWVVDRIFGDGDGQVTTVGVQVGLWIVISAIVVFGVVKSRIRILCNLLLVASASLVVILFVEGVARLYDYLYGVPSLSHREFRLSKPKPYESSPYFSYEFINESFVQPGGWHTPEGTRLVLPRDFKGRYFNTQAGFRVTTNAPLNHSHRVFILGGSTVYGSEVPDSLTIASCLQRYLNAAYPNQLQVVNCGAPSVTSSQELERLSFLSILRGDIVIVYDGVNDIYQGVYNANPLGWVVGENRRALSNMRVQEKILFWIFDKLGDESVFVRRFLSPFSGNIPIHLTDEKRAKELAQSTSMQFFTNLVTADSLCRLKGVTLVHFLQPSLFTKSHLSDYELSVFSNSSLVPPGMKHAFRYGFPMLRQCVSELGRAGVRSYDISHILDSLSDEVYLDCWHMTELGNRVVAERIFNTISTHLLPTCTQVTVSH